MLISVIIPNYNGLTLLKSCLESLFLQTFTDYEIIVVDNHSTDGSVAYLEQYQAAVRLVKLSKNFGFCRAVNIGVKKAHAPYIFLLNNDTVLHSNALGSLYHTISRSSDIFSVSGKMLMMDKPDQIDSAGDLYTLMGYAVCRGQNRSRSHYSKSASVFSSCAGAALYRKDLFLKLGSLDEKFFAYLEDVDLGYRARLHGYKNVFCPCAFIWHKRSSTSGHGYSPFKVYHSARNNVYLIHKNMPLLQLLINFPFLVLGTALKYFYFKKNGLSGSYASGLWHGLKGIRKAPAPVFSHTMQLRSIHIQMDMIRFSFCYLKDFLLSHLNL